MVAQFLGPVNAQSDEGTPPLASAVDGVPLWTLARRVEGAFPSPVNPVAVWEIKEYYYTTTFGSRVADGVYESLLDGMELAAVGRALIPGHPGGWGRWLLLLSCVLAMIYHDRPEHEHATLTAGITGAGRRQRTRAGASGERGANPVSAPTPAGGGACCAFVRQP